MNRFTSIELLTIAAAAVVSGAVWASQSGTMLSMNSRVVSRDIRMLDGNAYVRISDMASALGMSAVKTKGNYTIASVAGSNQLRGIPGKIGDEVSSGAWLFKVASMAESTTFTPQHGLDRDPIAPAEPGDILVVLTCRLKNGTKQTQEVSFDKDSAGNTALTDDQDHGFVPLRFDSRNSNYSSARMLPGLANDFSIIFSVPKSAALRDLVFTVRAGEMEKNTDFRISLTPGRAISK